MKSTASLALARLNTAVAVDRALSVRNDALEYTNVSSSDAIRMGQIFNGYATESGANVNEHTAMRVSAVYAACRLVVTALACTPCAFYRRSKDDTRTKENDHPYWWLLNEQPTPRFTGATFWEFIGLQALLRGDGIAYIARKHKYSTEATAFIPVRRENVDILVRGDRLAYRIKETNQEGAVSYFTADQDDVLHFPGFGFNGVHSMSIIQYAARQAIGIALRAEEHAAQTFGNGAAIQYAVKAPKAMTTTQQEDFRNAWVAKYSGQGVSKFPLVLTEGLEVQELSLTPADSQLLETRKFEVIDIARAIGVPPHMIGETTAASSFGTGIEQMGIGFNKYTMRPWYNRFGQELNRKLFPVRSAVFCEFNTDAQLEGDSKAQSEYFSKALGGPGTQGWMAVNEVRAIKNLPPVPGGDKVFDPTAGTPATAKPGEEPADEPADEPATDPDAKVKETA